MPDSFVASSIVPSSPNLEDVTKSTGSVISTPFSFASSMISGTIFAPSSSYSEPPIETPSSTWQ